MDSQYGMAALVGGVGLLAIYVSGGWLVPILSFGGAFWATDVAVKAVSK